MTINMALLIAAFICFVVAAISWTVPRVNITAFGLALWVLSLLVRS